MQDEELDVRRGREAIETNHCSKTVKCKCSKMNYLKVESRDDCRVFRSTGPFAFQIRIDSRHQHWLRDAQLQLFMLHGSPPLLDAVLYRSPTYIICLRFPNANSIRTEVDLLNLHVMIGQVDWNRKLLVLWKSNIYISRMHLCIGRDNRHTIFLTFYTFL